MPEIHVNITAILVTVVATFLLGFIWYTPLFGKVWAKEMGFDTSVKPTTGQFMKGIIINIIGNFFLAWVLAHDIAAWNPVTWGGEPSTMSVGMTATMSAFFTWLGFFLPVDLNSIAWEGKSMKLFFINTGYHFLNLLLASFILCSM